MKRWLVTFVAWLASTTLLAPLCLVAVFVLNGPHGGLLPWQFGEVTLLLGWATLLVCPILIARWVWRRMR